MDLDAYLQQMLAGPDPAAKKAALAQALAASGLATLAGRNGGGWQGALRSAGQGGLLGMGAYNQAMGDAAQAPAHNLDAIGKVMGLKAQLQEEFSTTPQVVMQGGKPTFMQFGKRGTTRAADGMEPPPDTQMLNLGGRMQAVDKRTIAPGATFDVTMDPAQKDASARGWADINDRRAKESAEAKGTAGAAKPTWDSSSGQFVYPPSPDSPQGRAVAPQGYSRKADMNAAKSEKALIAIKEAEDLIDTATGSYFGAGIDQGARAFGAATPGAKASAQLKVAEASIMMNQPRMEGPQSNLDVAMYRQAAGQIGDSTVPPEQKKAALETIKKLHQKYAQMGKPQSVGASGGWSIKPVE